MVYGSMLVLVNTLLVIMLCHFFQGHIAVMIATIVFMFIGLILILVHADGKWIQTVKISHV